MPRIRQVSRQVAPETQMRTPAAQAEDFGGGEGLAQAGQQISQFAERVAEVQARKQNRVDSVARAKIRTGFLGYLNDEAMRVQSEEDITQPSTLAAFGTRARDKMNDFIATHEGSEESKARLMMELEESFSQQARSLSSFAVAEGEKLATQALRNDNTRTAAQAAASGDIEAGLAQVEENLLLYAGAFSPAKEAAERQNGRAMVYTEAFLSAMEENNMEGAKALLANEDFRVSVGDEAYRRYRLNILSEEKQRRAGEAAGQQALNKAAAILGIPVEQLTDDQRLEIAGLSAARTRMSLQDKIDEYERTTGKTATPEIVDRLAGVRGVALSLSETISELEEILGRSLTETELAKAAKIAEAEGNNTRSERRLNYLLDNSALFKSGQLEGQDRQRYVALAQELYNESLIIGRDSENRPVIFSPGLPPAIQRALEAQEITLLMPEDITPDRPEFGYEAPQVPEDQTVFGVYRKAVGIGPGLQAFAAQLPFIGENVSGEALTSQSIILNANRDLVRALQNNPKYAEGERNAITQELSLDPTMFTTTKAYFSRLVAVSKNLDRRIANYQAIANDPTIKKQEAADAESKLRDLKNYRAVLGMPPIVSKPEDVDDLGLVPGQIFVDQNTGNVYQVPQPKTASPRPGSTANR